jgi:hypothetical protein
MLSHLKLAGTLTRKLYRTAENAVIGKVLQKTSDTREQCNVKLTFDYLFFHILLTLPKLFRALYYHNAPDLSLAPFFMGIFLFSLWMLKRGLPANVVGAMAALNTLIIPMLSSFLNNQDTSPCYALIWILSILFCYLTAGLAITLLLGSLLCGYLVMISYVKLEHLQIWSSAGYPPESSYIFTPLLTCLYILFIIRVLGRHYNNILMLEQERTLLRQKQHSALVNQNLTKQFMLVKGLSRSGKSEYQEGNLELLEACFAEIEKQCQTAIDFLQNGHKHNGA